MEYVYAAMLLHSAGKEINDENVKSVLSASGVEADEARVKALVASLEGVNIDEAIKQAAPVAAAPAAAAAPAETAEEAPAEEEETEEEKEEEALEGLGALFG
ncbi:MAG TPA: 50S ribosomal protein P1 [Euryarchaeota archaeon]|nr:50S ribosomal protein L12P [archaeon BMS3Bbin15]HDL15801.1 50S ribosomal protein P1 [Euryarchaeota archaeon]